MQRSGRRVRPTDERVPVVGVAPLAVTPGGGRVRRYFSAAVVTGTLATLPLSSLTAGSRQTAPEDIAAADASLGPEHRPAPPASDTSPTPRDEARADGGDRSPSSAAEPAPMADAAGVPLVVPSAETVLVGFHESLNPGAVALGPTTPLEADLGAGTVPEAEVGPDPGPADAGPAAMVLPTRNRPSAATSAIDIAVPEGAAVNAPVSGEVVGVTPYFLYGQHPDVRIDIAPEGRPDLRVIVIHVTDVAVSVGDRLVAGETLLAGSAAPFPFKSQIDRFASEIHGEPTPHVHLEVTRVA